MPDLRLGRMSGDYRQPGIAGVGARGPTMIIPIRIFLFNEYSRLSPGQAPCAPPPPPRAPPLRANEINAWTALSSYPNMNKL